MQELLTSFGEADRKAILPLKSHSKPLYNSQGLHAEAHPWASICKTLYLRINVIKNILYSKLVNKIKI